MIINAGREHVIPTLTASCHNHQCWMGARDATLISIMSGGHDTPMKLTVACAAGHFAPACSATKRKVVQTLTLAQCPPQFLFNNKKSYNGILN